MTEAAGSKLAQEPEKEGEEDAGEEAGHEGEIETGVAPREMEVARQAAEPGAAQAGPEQDPRPGQQEPGDHEQFSKVIHHMRIRGHPIRGQTITLHFPGRGRAVAAEMTLTIQQTAQRPLTGTWKNLNKIAYLHQ